jgi:hypothetical protein
MMKAEVGAIWVVTGRRSAMVRAGPMPGSTPMAVPRTEPTKAQTRFIGWRATPKPCRRELMASTSDRPAAGQRPRRGRKPPRLTPRRTKPK